MGKIIGGVVVVVVLLGLFLWWQGKNNSSVMMSEKNQMSGSENAPNNEKTAGGGGIVASIKDAMGLGQKMQCTYTSGTGNTAMTSTVFVSGPKFKSESEVNGTKVYALFDGEMQYTWMGNTKQGTKMSKACLDEMKAALPTTQEGAGSGTPKAEDYSKTFDAANNVSCTPSTGADFSVPTDITFTDQCAMMKQSMEMMKQMKDKMPTGMNPSGVPSGQ